MGLSSKIPVSKYLIAAVIFAGGGYFSALTSIATKAETIYSSPMVSQQLAQSLRQSGLLGKGRARLSLRITELENEIRRLTGLNEELAHRLGQLEDQLKKSTSDAVLRLKALEGGGGAAGASGMAAGAPLDSNNARGAASALVGNATITGFDKGAKVLGTLRQRSGPGGTEIARVVKPPPVAKAETPNEQYDRAHTLIVKHRKYGEAERVLRSFINRNPKHALTSNAHYWLGRTFFVRADYENAAFAFAEGFQQFPKSTKAPANLLNLGMSLSRLGKNREACTTYTRLLRTYRDVRDSIRRRIKAERRRAKCRRR